MATSLRTHKLWIALLALLILTSQADATVCKFIPSYIHIAEWRSTPPNRVALQVISIEEGQRKVVETIPYSAYVADPIPAYGWGPTLSIEPLDSNRISLMIDREYTILIDDKPVYNISSIESNRPALGCPVTSFKVNSCQGKLRSHLRFDASCR